MLKNWLAFGKYDVHRIDLLKLIDEFMQAFWQTTLHRQHFQLLSGRQTVVCHQMVVATDFHAEKVKRPV
jgi:hypothetical protein